MSLVYYFLGHSELRKYQNFTNFNMAAVRHVVFVGEVVGPPTNVHSW